MKLYALLDYETILKKKWTIEKFISTCKALHVEIIQYRDKLGDKERKKENLQKIKSLCEIKILINDDIDLVAFCDGLHVGQVDLEKISTNNKEEILEANELDIDYIGLGAYRSTRTKSDASVLKESLSDLASLSFKPVGAIGGVKICDEISNVTYAVVGSDIYEH